MKKFFLIGIILTSILFSGCALLGGAQMRPIVIGKMLIYTRLSSAKVFIATEMPEKLEIDTPFSSNGQFFYKDAVHDTTLETAGITLGDEDLEMTFLLFSYSKASKNNPEIFPSDASESQKTKKIFTAFDQYFTGVTDKDLIDSGYDAENKFSYKCITRELDNGTSEDVCGAAKLTDKGNIVFVIMHSPTMGLSIKKELLESIYSVEFKN